MNQRTQWRTMSSFLMMVAVVWLNSLMQFLHFYGPRLAIPIYVVTALILLGTLRYQQRLRRSWLLLLLLLPIGLIMAASLLGA